MQQTIRAHYSTVRYPDLPVFLQYISRPFLFFIQDRIPNGVTAHSVYSELEQVNKNNSSLSDEDYHQSDDGDHYSELEE
eukprot:15168034-Ditylum_brightwellii.AAC.1